MKRERSWANSSAVVIVMAALLLNSVPAGALIFDRDDRETVSTAPGSLFGPIGLVYGTAEAAYGTAFLIDDCHALTVQHVFGSVRSPIGRKVMFAANVQGGPSNWTTTSAKVVAAGGLERFQAASERDSARASDWALLRLKKCLGRVFGSVRLIGRPPVAIEKLELEDAGYPIDRPLAAGLAVDPSCHVRLVRSPVWLHDCAALAGNSGGPIFRQVHEGKSIVLEVYAMHSAGMPARTKLLPFFVHYPDQYANVATPISSMLGLQ